MAKVNRKSMDSLDKRTIEALCSSGRESYHQLAKKLGVTTSTVTHRVKALKEAGVLKGFRVIADIEKLGYEYMAIVLIYSESSDGDSIVKSLAESDKVMGAFEVVGECTLIAWVACHDREQFSDLMKEMLRIPGVKRVHPYVIMKIAKDPCCYVPSVVAGE